MKDNQVFFKIMVQDETISNHYFKTKLIGTYVRYETPAGKARRRENPQASAEEAPGPPAESECLEWKSTSGNFNHIRGVEGLFCWIQVRPEFLHYAVS
jgi:hypothetical protein